MDNKKIEVEFSVKDNLTKKLKSMSDEVKNIAKEIQSSVRQIENSFSNINIKTNMSSKVKSINNQMKQIGKDIGDVEVDIKAKIDESGLGGIDLGDLLSTGSMLGASSEITNSSKEMATSIDEMSKSFGEMFDIGIKNTDAYQQKIGELKQVFEDLKIATSGKLDVFDLSNLLNELEIDISRLTGFFDSFSGSITSAKNSAIALKDILGAMKNISDSVDWKNIEPDSPVNLDNIQVDYNKIEEVINTAIRYAQPDEEIKISANAEEAVNTATRIAEMAGQITEKEYALKINTEYMERAKSRIEELKNSINDFNKVEISGKINNQEKALNGTANVINRLKKEIKDLNAQSNNMKSTFDGLTNSTNKVNKSINGMTNSTSKLKSAFGGIKGILGKLGLLAGIAQLVNFGKASIQTASSLEEVQNVVDVVFGDTAETINQWSSSISEAFGLTELQAKQFSSTFGSIFKSSGIDTSYIDTMSMKLTELAGDMASFYDMSQQDAFEKLKSGIVGSVEPLQALGINMNVASLEAYALSQGITTSYSSMSEADKQILRYNYLLQQTAMVQGDYARTSGSFANQVRNLSNAFSQLKAEVGIALMAALQPVISVISTVINWLTALMQVLNDFLRSIGLIKTASKNVSNAVGAIAGGIGEIVGVGGGVDDVASSVGGVGDSASSASGAVAELKKEIKGLMGIDELNILPEPDKDSGGSGSSGGSGGGGAGAGSGAGGGGIIPDTGESEQNEEENESILDRMKAKIQEFVDFVKKNADLIISIVAGVSAGILTYLGIVNFGSIIASISGAIEGIGLIVSGVIASISPIALAVSAVVALLVGGFVYLYRTSDEFRARVNKVGSEMVAIFKKVYDVAIKPIGDALLAVWNGVLKPLVSFLGGVVLDVVEAIWSAIEYGWGFIRPALDSLLDSVSSMYDAIANLWNSVLQPLLTWLIGILKIVYEACKPVLTFIIELAGIIAGALISVVIYLAKSFIDFVTNVINGIVDMIDWFKNFGENMSEIWENVKEVGKKCWDNILQFAKSCWEGICNAWQGAKDWFNNNVLTPIKNFFSNAWNNIKTLVSNAWTNICNIWKIASSWFSNNVLTPIKNVFTTVWDNIKQIPKNAWTAICNVYQGAKSWFSNIFDGVKTAITSKFDDVKTKVSNVFENVKNTVSNAIEKIKGFFKFDWSLPHIKLPHFSISGSANPLKWITEGVPKISVKFCTFLVEILTRKFGKIGRKLSKLLINLYVDTEVN